MTKKRPYHDAKVLMLRALEDGLSADDRAAIPLPEGEEREQQAERMASEIMAKLLSEYDDITIEELERIGLPERVLLITTHALERRRRRWDQAHHLFDRYRMAAREEDCAQALVLALDARDAFLEFPVAAAEALRELATAIAVLRELERREREREQTRRRDERLAERAQKRAAPVVDSPRCIRCGKKPRQIDDYCKKCARDLGIIVHGKIT
jgi:hypothetical protein